MIEHESFIYIEPSYTKYVHFHKKHKAIQLREVTLVDSEYQDYKPKKKNKLAKHSQKTGFYFYSLHFLFFLFRLKGT